MTKNEIELSESSLDSVASELLGLLNDAQLCAKYYDFRDTLQKMIIQKFPDEKFENFTVEVERYFEIDGYWEDGEKILNYLVTDKEFQEETVETVEDDKIFYYGLSEEQIKKAIENKELIGEFYITDYRVIVGDPFH